jgi:hypothetical protein
VNKRVVTVLAGALAIGVAGCGSAASVHTGTSTTRAPAPTTSAPAPKGQVGPSRVVEQYFADIGTRNGQAVCDISTSKLRAALIAAAVSAGLPHSTCAQAVKAGEQSLGEDTLGPLRHATVHVLSESGTTARVQRVGGTDVLTMIRVRSSWLVDGIARPK